MHAYGLKIENVRHIIHACTGVEHESGSLYQPGVTVYAFENSQLEHVVDVFENSQLNHFVKVFVEFVTRKIFLNGIKQLFLDALTKIAILTAGSSCDLERLLQMTLSAQRNRHHHQP